jgi:hypothetical protein
MEDIKNELVNEFIYAKPNNMQHLKEILKDDSLRLKVYLYMLAELKIRQAGDYSAGMCHTCPWFMKSVWGDSCVTRLKNLPELWRRKPRNHEEHGSYWFDDRDFDIRYAILNHAISKLKTKLNQPT